MSLTIDNKNSKTTLGLQLKTDPRWADLASISLEEILTDHAYCEQKAATSGITMIQAYPDKTLMVKELAPLVTEEWGHFRLVLAEMDKRGFALGPQRKDEYVNALMKFQIQGGSREDRLLDKLLTFALIEARSCERFRLLSLHLEDEHLKQFYHKFMVSEAGHYRMFLDLSIHYFGEKMAMSRWQQFLDFEENLMETIEPRGDRMH